MNGLNAQQNRLKSAVMFQIHSKDAKENEPFKLKKKLLAESQKVKSKVWLNKSFEL